MVSIFMAGIFGRNEDVEESGKNPSKSREVLRKSEKKKTTSYCWKVLYYTAIETPGAGIGFDGIDFQFADSKKRRAFLTPMEIDPKWGTPSTPMSLKTQEMVEPGSTKRKFKRRTELRPLKHQQLRNTTTVERNT